MKLNIVANSNIMSIFKESNHFIKNLGYAATKELNNQRLLADYDLFIKFYGTEYKTIIYSQGSIGDISFYTDHYVNNNVFGVYCGNEFKEIIFNFDFNLKNEKGIDFYIGYIIKKVEEELDSKIIKNTNNDETIISGQANKLITNPGNVTYDDVRAYILEKQKHRYK